MSAERNLPTVDGFIDQVLPPARRQSLGLPAHVKPETFVRNLSNAIMNNPKLLNCNPDEVFREVAKLAALGLLLDQQLGEAYLIVGWNGRERREVPQVRVGYRGLIKLARQSGEIAQIYAHEVRDGDVFDVSLGDEKKLVHKPKPFGTGAIVGYYAVAKYADGTSDFELMSLERIHEIRDRSDGWKAFSEGKIKSTPWSSDAGEMSRKTCIRNLVKRLPASPELSDAIGIEDRAEYAGMKDVTPGAAALDGPPAPPPSLEHQPVAPVQVNRQTVREPADRTSQPYADMNQQTSSQDGLQSHNEDGVIDQKPVDTDRWDKLLEDLDRKLNRCLTPEQIDGFIEAYKLEIQQAPHDYREEGKRLVREHRERVAERMKNIAEAKAFDKAKPVEEKPAPAADPDEAAAQAEAAAETTGEASAGAASAEGEGAPEQSGPTPEPATPPAPPADAGPPPPPADEEADPDPLRTQARMKALEGRTRLRFWLTRLDPERRDYLRQFDAELFAAADAADKARPAEDA